jgi:hypothetical protein
MALRRAGGAGLPKYLSSGRVWGEGQFQFLAGERLIGAPPRTFVFVPRGTVHAVKNVGTEPGRVLAAFIPGGTEGSFEAFARLRAEQGGDADQAAQVRLWWSDTRPSSSAHPCSLLSRRRYQRGRLIPPQSEAQEM